MAEIAVIAALAVFALSVTLAFILISWRYGVVKGLLAALLLAKLLAAMFMLLGVDRPIATVKTKLGDFTITAMMLFLASSFVTTIYIAARLGDLDRIFK